MNDVKIGCEIFIREGDRILLGKRKNCFGAGTWALPGGHLERGERAAETICREMMEEMNAKIAPENLKLVSVVDDICSNDHYLHLSFELRNPNFTPEIAEPDLCEEWRYFAVDELPMDNLFLPHKQILKNYLGDRLY